MLVVDAQTHLWEKDTPSAHHRQEPYSAEQAIASMDEAGVDRALIHPVLWYPDSNELAVEAVPNATASRSWAGSSRRSQRPRPRRALERCRALSAMAGGERGWE
jgi:predicted TIM-barrel fold metal-dependent hydrolase